MKKFYRQLYRQRYLILMMLPGLLWFLIFKYCTYAGLGLAFTNYGFKKSVDFVGLRNFNRLFKSAQFWTAFKNTMIISICNIVFYFPFPIIIALLINELRSLRTKRAVQFMIYIPYFFFLGSSRNDFREHPFSIQRCGKPDFKCTGTGFNLLYGRSEMVPRGTDRFLYLETDGIWRSHLCGNPFHRGSTAL